MPGATATATSAARKTAAMLSHWPQDSSNLPDEASLIHDLQQYQTQQQQPLSQLSSPDVGLPGTDFGLFGPESVHDPSLAFLDPSPWDTLPWTSAASATPHVGASPLDNSIGQPFPFIDTPPPDLFDTFSDLFDTFSDPFLSVQLDPTFGSSDNSNSNSPNQPPPLDMSVYATVPSGAPKSHRSSPNSDGRDSEMATPHADKVLRRQRNTIAARKYRQKKVDRIDELESLLKEMTRERDDLRIRLARQEAETEALKSIMERDAKK
ncbi:bZIP transcription factor [Colletotrichum graminicola M1.001]|uniref:BZIP transcription factor n=1 Tax=Colletotrichum graminicola (strain M1.001 / M2 / FGSC 10212) TaxID=645133 RepID=E3QFJ7_COLGM|nr:bZIP transcription factor [Colletotrichum graminicola M1.001]EFQ29635.1 bZIP transcription factor [Colletotrichum graminicola M1.001]